MNRTRAARMRDGDTEEGPRDPLWPVKEALAQVYEAEKTYDALYGACVFDGGSCGFDGWFGLEGFWSMGWADV